MRPRIAAVCACLRGEFTLLPRRLCRLLPLCLFLAAVSLAACAAVAAGAGRKDAPLALALVDREDSFLSRAAVGAVAANNTVSALFTVENCAEADALAGLQNGTYAAAMIFAEDFISGILDGDENAVRILLSDALQRSGAIVADAAGIGEILMQTAEAAVNFAWQPLQSALPASEAAHAFDKLELACAVEFFTLPGAAFTDETLAYSANGLSLAAHYFVCYAVLLLFLSEAVFAGDVQKSCSFALYSRLRALGISDGAFLLGKCGIPFLCRVLLLAGLGFAAHHAHLFTPHAGAILSALCAVFLLSLFLCSLSVAFSASPLGAAVPCALGGACLFLCGGLLPLHLLPETVASVGALTPFGAARDLLAPLFGGHTAASAGFLLIGWTAVAVLLALCALRRLIQNGGLTV